MSACATIADWEVDGAEERREVTPRREPIPELVQVGLQVHLKLRHRLAVNTGAAPGL